MYETKEALVEQYRRVHVGDRRGGSDMALRLGEPRRPGATAATAPGTHATCRC